jgi:Zn-dependent peptidase ImmA (M78 family)/transcriptional regulator with XRE-family HTH domain
LTTHGFFVYCQLLFMEGEGMIGERIRSARILASLTLQQVADALTGRGRSRTKAALSKYELGKSTPPATLLLELAAIMNVPAAYFLHEPSFSVSWHRYRKLSTLGKTDQKRICIMAEDIVEKQLTLWSHLGGIPAPDIPARIAVGSEAEAELAAARTREHWGLGSYPIESVTALLEDRGWIVVETPESEGEFHGLSGIADGSYPVIVMSSMPSDDRKRSNLAHEIGHLVMDCGSLGEKEEESCAKRFAAAFLAPENVVLRELGSSRSSIRVEELGVLKRKYGLSMQSWIRRALDLGIITPACYETVCRRFGAQGWRKSEPVVYSGFEEPVRLKQLAYRALAEGMISRSELTSYCPGYAADLEENETMGSRGLLPSEILRLPEAERRELLLEAVEQAQPYYMEESGPAGFDALGDEDVPDDDDQG